MSVENRITPEKIAEALTARDNEYDESVEGWVGLSAEGNVRQERLDLWEGRSEEYAAEYAAESREEIAKVDALLAALADQAETWDGDQ